ncbi:MAG: hypothetical protein ACHQVK_00670 [Candidatus Paceibacterales bacterium]
MFAKIKFFIPLAVLITGLSGLVYWVVQQDIRIGSYEPQIQMSEDAAARISAGEDPVKVVPTDSVEITKSVAPYVIVFDENGKVLATDARLNGKAPTVPQGVLDYAKVHNQDRVSWQPMSGVRSAIIVTKFSNSKISGTVVSGRSLREPEKRVEMLGLQVLLAWSATIFATFAAVIVFADGKKR